MKNKKAKLMGFGHRVYKSYDPRAKVELAFDVSERRILRKHLEGTEEPNDPNAPQPTITERSAVQIKNGDKIVEVTNGKVVAEILSKTVTKTEKKKTTTTTFS